MADLQALLKDKTPISFLQEICSRKKLTPSYDVLANEGPIHEPVFVMRAQAGDFQGTGKGSSKKKAKHHAAEDLLRNMYNVEAKQGEPMGSPSSSSQNSTSSPNKSMVNGGSVEHSDSQLQAGIFDGDIQGNPIGELQEYTQKHLLKPPAYDFIGEEGPPHAREFVCTVKLAKLQETAVGKSKKIAKRAAACKMLQAIQQHQTDSTSLPIVDDEDDDLPLPPSVNGIKTLTEEGGRLATEFFEQHKLSCKAPGSGRGVQYLHTTSLNSTTENFIKLLEDVAKSSKFEISYLDIKQKSYSGQYQCMVQISTAPIAVCFGIGATAEDAKMNAACNTLQYLKIMTSES